MKSKSKKASFNDLLAALENLVEKMENSDTSLDISLKEFEQGIALTHEAQKLLTDAEQRIQLLIEKGDEPVSQTFDPEDKQ